MLMEQLVMVGGHFYQTNSTIQMGPSMDYKCGLKTGLKNSYCFGGSLFFESSH